MSVTVPLQIMNVWVIVLVVSNYSSITLICFLSFLYLPNTYFFCKKKKKSFKMICVCFRLSSVHASLQGKESKDPWPYTDDKWWSLNSNPWLFPLRLKMDNIQELGSFFPRKKQSSLRQGSQFQLHSCASKKKLVVQYQAIEPSWKHYRLISNGKHYEENIQTLGSQSLNLHLCHCSWP